MNKDMHLKEYGIEFAIEKIAMQITEKMKKLKETKDEKVQEEILQLIKDREEIYSNNEEVIKKYLK